MFTVHKGHEEATKQLLNAGADVNFLSGFWTPISLAARMGNLSILKLLLKQVRKSDLNLTPLTSKKLTPQKTDGVGPPRRGPIRCSRAAMGGTLFITPPEQASGRRYDTLDIPRGPTRTTGLPSPLLASSATQARREVESEAGFFAHVWMTSLLACTPASCGNTPRATLFPP
jgi:hypothetical protein